MNGVNCLKNETISEIVDKIVMYVLIAFVAGVMFGSVLPFGWRKKEFNNGYEAAKTELSESWYRDGYEDGYNDGYYVCEKEMK